MRLAVAILMGMVSQVWAQPLTKGLEPFFTKYCLDCHDAQSKKAGLNLEALDRNITANSYSDWRRVFDQIERADMPPKKKLQPSRVEREKAVSLLLASLVPHLKSSQKSQTVLRRLNRMEYRNTVGDLMNLDVSLWDPTEEFPEDETDHGFNNIGETLVTSDFLLQKQLAAATKIIGRTIRFEDRPKVIRFAAKPPDPHYKQTAMTRHAWEMLSKDYLSLYSRGNGNKGTYVVVPSGEITPHESGPRVKAWEGAPIAGRYRFRVVASYDAGGDWFSEVTHDPTEVPTLALTVAPWGFNLPTRESPRDIQIYDWALPRDGRQKSMEIEIQLEPDWFPKVSWLNGPSKNPSLDLVVKYAPKRWEAVDKKKLSSKEKGQWLRRMGRELAKIYRGPSVRIHELSIEGPIFDQWPPTGHQLLFGKNNWEDVDPRDFLEEFASRAFRRPIETGEIDPILKMVNTSLANGVAREVALRNGLRAVLVSPQFLYLDENEGELDDYSLASRLSYFLWSTMPDKELLKLAETGKLREPETLRIQVNRMLADKKSNAFIRNFTNRWLELYKLGMMPPDAKGFGAWYYQGQLERNGREETERFFRHLLDENLGVSYFIDSDFTFLNYPLAKLYGIKGINSRTFEKVNLNDKRRGGLLGQASVLTASANGIDTSPVVRGVWVLENLLGMPPLPPPDNVAAIEPDIRGATTIREQLAKHRGVESCATCHQKIDPLGFALENFDPIGGWRRAAPGQRGEVDASGEWTGHRFKDIVDLKKLLVQQEDLVARNLAGKLLTYATGRKLDLPARPHLDRIVLASKSKGHGLKDLVHLVVQSEIFMKK